MLAFRQRPAQDRLGAWAGPTLRTGLVSIAPSSMANWKIRMASDWQWAVVEGPTFRPVVLPAAPPGGGALRGDCGGLPGP